VTKLEGSHIAIVRRGPYNQQRWECQRCGRGGMWMGVYYDGSYPSAQQLRYALEKHRCIVTEADSLATAARLS
jgi:hypothetical protein